MLACRWPGRRDINHRQAGSKPIGLKQLLLTDSRPMPTGLRQARSGHLQGRQVQLGPHRLLLRATISSQAARLTRQQLTPSRPCLSRMPLQCKLIMAMLRKGQPKVFPVRMKTPGSEKLLKLRYKSYCSTALSSPPESCNCIPGILSCNNEREEPA